MSQKSDAVETDSRVRHVVKWLLECQSTADIIRTCVTNWGVGDRQAYNYLKTARKELRAHNEKDLEDTKAFHIAARKELYKKLPDKTDPYQAQVALNILQDMAKIQGGYPEKAATLKATLPGGESDEPTVIEVQLDI